MDRMKLLSLCLAVLLCAGACTGCTQAQQLLPSDAEQQTSDEGTSDTISELRVPFDASDSLDPYLATTTLSLQVGTLLYDSLVRLDPAFEPQPCIAETLEYSQNTCTVRLRSGLRFTDGTALTAQDVVRSAELARSSTAYGYLMSTVETVEATDERTVVFTLTAPDVRFGALLTFPIIKRLEDGTAIGSGRYRRSETDAQTLVPNPDWYGDARSPIETIRLVDLPDPDAAAYELRLGELDLICFTDTDDPDLELGASTSEVSTNYLIYLGMNCLSGRTAELRCRQLLQAALDRGAVTEAAYGSRAQATAVPFHPQLHEVQALGLSTAADSSLTGDILAEMGFDKRDEAGYNNNAYGQRLTLKLLYNSDSTGKARMAEQLQAGYAEAGIEIVLDGRPYDAYQQALAAGEFELYLGEVRLKENMDLTAMLTPGSQAAYGIAYDEALMTAHAQLQAGQLTIAQFCDQFDAALPFLPICYRNALVSFSRTVDWNITATAQDMFYNIEDWTFA